MPDVREGDIVKVPRSTEHIVTLRRPPATIEALRNREIVLGILPGSGGEWVGLLIRNEDGTPAPIARSYVESLKDEGWEGLGQIPDECIVG